jgi:hypothetical protein
MSALGRAPAPQAVHPRSGDVGCARERLGNRMAVGALLRQHPLPLSLKVPALGLPLFPGSRGAAASTVQQVPFVLGEPRHERAVRMSKCCLFAVKRASGRADRWHMIISEKQVSLVRDYLHTQIAPASQPTTAPSAVVTPDFMDRVRREIALAPETRDDRVAEARELIAGQGMSSDEVAEKMIGRILSDSIR